MIKLLVIFGVAVVWSVGFGLAAREEIADCWRCHRAARKAGR